MIRAACDIAAGEEVTNCYGPHAGHMKTALRQLALKQQYFFDCRCSACSKSALFNRPLRAHRAFALARPELYDRFKCQVADCSGALNERASGSGRQFACERCRTEVRLCSHGLQKSSHRFSARLMASDWINSTRKLRE